MKRLLSIVGLVLVAAIATLFLTPFLVSPQAIATVVEGRLEDMTGRDVTLGGPVAISVFPDLVARIDDVQIKNPPGFGEEPMVQINAVDAKVRLLPLLQGRIEVARLTFIEPRIALLTDAKGRGNWTFDAEDAAEAPPQNDSAGAPAQNNSNSSGGSFQFAGIGELRIEQGDLLVASANGMQNQVDNIDATINWPQLAEPLDFSVSMSWQGIPLAVTGQLAAPQQLVSGTSSDVALGLTAANLKTTFSGKLNLASDIAADGQLQLAASSLRDAAAAFGVDLPASQGFGEFTLSATAILGGSKMSLADAALTIDGNAAEGAIGITFAPERPSIRATLAFTNLNLNPYLAARSVDGEQQAAAQTAPNSTTQAGTGGGWSDQPIDLSGLSAIDADLRISASEIALHELPLGGGALTLNTSKGKLVAEIGELQGYGGQLAGTLQVHAARKVPTYMLSLNARNVALKPFLTDLIGLSRLSAQGNVDIAVKSAGQSERQIVSNLSGDAAFNTGPGTVEGIDFASLVGLVQKGSLDGWQNAGGATTSFDSLQASFLIDQGIAHNSDLALTSPSLAVNGAGIVDLPARSLDYRLETVLASGLPVQTDGTPPAFRIPVTVRGPWDRPSFFVDPTALLQNAPVIEDTVKNVKDAIKDGDLKAIEDQLENSGLKSLFDNLTGRKKN